MGVLAFEWVDPARQARTLAPFQQTTIERAARLHNQATGRVADYEIR